MTKFMTLDGKKKEGKKTVFNYIVGGTLEIEGAYLQPSDYNNVLFLGHDNQYGDVFRAWNNYDEEFTICFGEKGDEFND